MRTFDFTPFARSSVGFDRLFDMLENSMAGTQADNFLPFDLLKLDDQAFRVDLAVAGFKREEIEITDHENVLVVRGQKAEAMSTAALQPALLNAALLWPITSR